MDIFDAVASRYSCRAFLPKPVPEKTVRDIVERAARAPSAGNLQPWRIYAIAGERLGALKALLVPREDRPARYRQYARNYDFFGAPAALFFAREKSHGAAQWADIGGYLQTVALLARGHGLHTCPQQAWVSFHKTVRSFLDLPDDLMIYSGMALGYEDPDAPINGWRSPRAAVDVFASFDGFES